MDGPEFIPSGDGNHYPYWHAHFHEGIVLVGLQSRHKGRSGPQPFDFRTPTKLGREHIRALQMVNDVLSLGVPVGLLDGRPATAEGWAYLLLAGATS